ncbi:Peptidase M14 carboxypeptidase A [Trinorchestia longiramus]|nr:Peptidase M14 carboxypeptidase A [Trinorchestia longiramus]
MRSDLIIGLLWALCWSSVMAKHPRQTHRALEEHKVVRMNGENLGPLLTEAQKALPALDVLHYDGSQQVRVRVAREDVEAFKNMMDGAKLDYVVEVEDLADHLRRHDLEQELTASSRIEETCDEKGCSKPPKTYYMTFEQMEWYMQDLAANYPSRVQLSSVGKSVEGRDIWMVNVLPDGSSSSDRSLPSPASVWIEGGLHAREWISPSSTLQLLHKIATACENHCDLNYYFVPMANPDGYEYSRTQNRMWRKNRAVNSGSSCYGVDLNRNWDYKYGVGASDDPCSETFMGPSAFSEPETRSISQAMSQVENFELMITFHSYGQTVLYPWGWTKTPINDKSRLVRVGNAFADAVQETTGQKYRVENSAGGLYLAAGATDDWSKGRLNVPFTYTIELRDSGANGFLIPATDIASTAEEVIAGVTRLISQVRDELNSSWSNNTSFQKVEKIQ